MTDVQLTVRGEVSDEAAGYALGKLRHAAGQTPARVHVVLTVAANPANETPATVEAEAEVAGSPVHVHAAAGSVTEAVDVAADRLRRRLTDLRGRAVSRRRSGRSRPAVTPSAAQAAAAFEQEERVHD